MSTAYPEWRSTAKAALDESNRPKRKPATPKPPTRRELIERLREEIQDAAASPRQRGRLLVLLDAIESAKNDSTIEGEDDDEKPNVVFGARSAIAARPSRWSGCANSPIWVWRVSCTWLSRSVSASRPSTAGRNPRRLAHLGHGRCAGRVRLPRARACQACTLLRSVAGRGRATRGRGRRDACMGRELPGRDAGIVRPSGASPSWPLEQTHDIE